MYVCTLYICMCVHVRVYLHSFWCRSGLKIYVVYRIDLLSLISSLVYGRSQYFLLGCLFVCIEFSVKLFVKKDFATVYQLQNICRLILLLFLILSYLYLRLVFKNINLPDLTAYHVIFFYYLLVFAFNFKNINIPDLTAY